MSDKIKQERLAELSAHAETYNGVQREADKKVRRRTKLGVEEITKREAIYQKLVDDALTKGPHSMRLMLQVMNEAEEFERLELEEEHWVWSQVKKRNQRAISDALERGDAPPDVYPHPDDIIIESGRPVRFDGPLNQEEQRELQEKLWMREAYMIEDALVRAREKRRDDHTIEPWGPVFMAMQIDMILPDRLKWKQTGFFDNSQKYVHRSERELSKLRRKAWARVGVKARRNELLFRKYDVGAAMTALTRTLKRALADDNPVHVVEDIWVEEMEAVLVKAND